MFSTWGNLAVSLSYRPPDRYAVPPSADPPNFRTKRPRLSLVVASGGPIVPTRKATDVAQALSGPKGWPQVARPSRSIHLSRTRAKVPSISLADGLGHMFGDTALQPTRGTPAKVDPCNSGRHRIPKSKGLAWDEMRISRVQGGSCTIWLRPETVLGVSISSSVWRQVGENLSKNFKTLRNLARL